MAAKRYAIVGTGGRGLGMYARPLLHDFQDTAELVGLCDHNQLRLAAANQILGTALPTFTDFQAMLVALDPDGVVVCTQDRTHASYIVQALQAGKRVYCEKPLCTTAGKTPLHYRCAVPGDTGRSRPFPGRGVRHPQHALRAGGAKDQAASGHG